MCCCKKSKERSYPVETGGKASTNLWLTAMGPAELSEF